MPDEEERILRFMEEANRVLAEERAGFKTGLDAVNARLGKAVELLHEARYCLSFNYSTVSARIANFLKEIDAPV